MNCMKDVCSATVEGSGIFALLAVAPLAAAGAVLARSGAGTAPIVVCAKPALPAMVIAAAADAAGIPGRNWAGAGDAGAGAGADC